MSRQLSKATIRRARWLSLSSLLHRRRSLHVRLRWSGLGTEVVRVHCRFPALRRIHVCANAWLLKKCFTECLDVGVAPFSVVDPAAIDALSHLLSLTFAATDASDDPKAVDAVADASLSSACSLRALLAVPPAEMARWMVFDSHTQHGDGAIALIGGESIGTLHWNINVFPIAMVGFARIFKRASSHFRYHCGKRS